MLVASFLAVRWCLGPVVSPSLVAELEAGMTKQQVEDLLGVPSELDLNGDWVYSRRLNPGWFVVKFDAKDRVANCDHEVALPDLLY